MKKDLSMFISSIGRAINRHLTDVEIAKLTVNYYNNKVFTLEEVLEAHSAVIGIAVGYLRHIKDPEHDIGHTEDVVQNVTRLLPYILITETIDISVCYIGAFWHDVSRLYTYRDHEKLSADMLKGILIDFKYDDNFIQKCYLAIVNHKWNMNPTTIEGHVVRDADKLAFIGERRWNRCIQENVPLNNIVDFLPLLKSDILHFNASKVLFDKYIYEYINLLYTRLCESKRRTKHKITKPLP